MDNDDPSKLHQYCLDGDIGRVKELIKKVNINSRDIENRAPIHCAVYNGHLSIVQLLLSEKADINVQDNNGKTPLMIAIVYGHTEIVNTLLLHDANAELIDNEGNTSLQIALQTHQEEIICMLIKTIKDINGKNKDGFSALHIATMNKQYRIVTELLSFGADVNIKDNHKRTPVMIACERNDFQLVSLLLKYGADLFIRDASGKGVHDYTTSAEIMNLLLSRTDNKTHIDNQSHDSSSYSDISGISDIERYLNEIEKQNQKIPSIFQEIQENDKELYKIDDNADANNMEVIVNFLKSLKQFSTCNKEKLSTCKSCLSSKSHEVSLDKNNSENYSNEYVSDNKINRCKMESKVESIDSYEKESELSDLRLIPVSQMKSEDCIKQNKSQKYKRKIKSSKSSDSQNSLDLSAELTQKNIVLEKFLSAEENIQIPINSKNASFQSKNMTELGIFKKEQGNKEILPKFSVNNLSSCMKSSIVTRQINKDKEKELDQPLKIICKNNSSFDHHVENKENNTINFDDENNYEISNTVDSENSSLIKTHVSQLSGYKTKNTWECKKSSLEHLNIEKEHSSDPIETIKERTYLEHGDTIENNGCESISIERKSFEFSTQDQLKNNNKCLQKEIENILIDESEIKVLHKESIKTQEFATEKFSYNDDDDMKMKLKKLLTVITYLDSQIEIQNNELNLKQEAINSLSNVYMEKIRILSDEKKELEIKLLNEIQKRSNLQTDIANAQKVAQKKLHTESTFNLTDNESTSVNLTVSRREKIEYLKEQLQQNSIKLNETKYEFTNQIFKLKTELDITKKLVNLYAKELETEMKKNKNNNKKFKYELTEKQKENKQLLMKLDDTENRLKIQKQNITILENEIKQQKSERYQNFENSKWLELRFIIDSIINEKSKLENAFENQKKYCQYLDLQLEEIKVEMNRTLNIVMNEKNELLNRLEKEKDFQIENCVQLKHLSKENEILRETLKKEKNHSKKLNKQLEQFIMLQKNMEIEKEEFKKTVEKLNKQIMKAKEWKRKILILIQKKDEIIDVLKEEINEMKSNLKVTEFELKDKQIENKNSMANNHINCYQETITLLQKQLKELKDKSEDKDKYIFSIETKCNSLQKDVQLLNTQYENMLQKNMQQSISLAKMDRDQPKNFNYVSIMEKPMDSYKTLLERCKILGEKCDIASYLINSLISKPCNNLHVHPDIKCKHHNSSFSQRNSLSSLSNLERRLPQK